MPKKGQSIFREFIRKGKSKQKVTEEREKPKREDKDDPFSARQLFLRRQKSNRQPTSKRK